MLDHLWLWYHHAIVAHGRQPLLFALLAFILTFVITRMITRLIRSGRGPFSNVSSGDVHVHHVVPGVVTLLLGGVLIMSSSRFGPWNSVGAVLFGIGAALVLDEFALILHLDDVYWSREGALSVDAITVATVVLASVLFVAAPENPPGPDRTDPHVKALAPAMFFAFWMLPVAITVAKGKLITAALAVLNPVFGWIGAVRLAKPGSPFAQLRYRTRPAKMARARAREAAWERRVLPVRNWWATHVFGLSLAEPAPTKAAEALLAQTTQTDRPSPTAQPAVADEAERPPSD